MGIFNKPGEPIETNKYIDHLLGINKIYKAQIDELKSQLSEAKIDREVEEVVRKNAVAILVTANNELELLRLVVKYNNHNYVEQGDVVVGYSCDVCSNTKHPSSYSRKMQRAY